MIFSQQLNLLRKVKRQANALISLRVCAGWSEPLLVAHTILLEISCHGSIKVLCFVLFSLFVVILNIILVIEIDVLVQPNLHMEILNESMLCVAIFFLQAQMMI